MKSYTFYSTLLGSSILVMFLMFSSPIYAQDPEYGESTGYIDAKYGIKEFQVKYTCIQDNNSKSLIRKQCYALDSSGQPATFLFGSFSTLPNSYSDAFRILYGTTRIAKGACNLITYPCTIYIPSTLRYIPEDLISNKYISLIVDDSETMPTSVSDVKEEETRAAKEVVRYNTQGIKTSPQEKGPQIIKYDNGTAKKVINKR